MKKEKKLQFSKETVRILTGSDLSKAVGGLTTYVSCTGGCETLACDTDYCDTAFCVRTTYLSCGGGCDTA